MDDVSGLDCRIFIDTGQPLDGTAALLVMLSRTRWKAIPPEERFRLTGANFDVRRNQEADGDRARRVSRWFPFLLAQSGISPAAEIRREDRVSLVARISNFLWDRGVPAVAVCDYEDALPRAGGYKDWTVPGRPTRRNPQLPRRMEEWKQAVPC